MKLHVHTFTWICGLVGCQPSSVAINFLDHVTKWAPHDFHLRPDSWTAVLLSWLLNGGGAW